MIGIDAGAAAAAVHAVLRELLAFRAPGRAFERVLGVMLRHRLSRFAALRGFPRPTWPADPRNSSRSAYRPWRPINRKALHGISRRRHPIPSTWWPAREALCAAPRECFARRCTSAARI